MTDTRDQEIERLNARIAELEAVVVEAEKQGVAVAKYYGADPEMFGLVKAARAALSDGEKRDG